MKAGAAVKPVLKILLGLGLIAFLMHETGVEKTMSALARADFRITLLCIALYLTAQAVSTYRWQFLAKAIGFACGFRELLDYYLIGMFSNQFLPGAVGGDAVRVFYLARRCQRKKREAVLTVLAERGVGMVTLLFMTAILFLTPQLSRTPWQIPIHIHFMAPFSCNARAIVLGMAVMMMAGYAAVWLLPIERLSQRFSRLALLLQAKVYWANLPLFLRSISLSILVQAVMVLIQILAAHAIGIHISIAQLTVVYGVVSLVSVLPLTQGGLGVRELAYQSLLTRLAVPSDTALAFGVYWLLISTLTALIGGIILLKGHYTPPPPDNPPESGAPLPANLKCV